MALVDILREISDERLRQDTKWGERNQSPTTWLPILTEEVGEVANAILEGDENNYRVELIQVAAVAIAMIECLDRGNKNEFNWKDLSDKLFDHLKHGDQEHQDWLHKELNDFIEKYKNGRNY